ncbi:unnamed protein product [Polarella glacialis]|uniref:Ketosynthase family 3 (KS3) domain-containing protein n=1 Tax=Polarella glacialis TaxID=89957 RepID=A0A813G6L3_POLGL|nr:unnamed protein product [Polarella glacialis]CAE8693468.1 unnamed protein product [Polarella glacialis]
MTAPHGPSQQECIRASLREANVTPADIRIAELHGTGTALGDPIEVGALRAVMKHRDTPIFKTSAKSNLAHAEANAGMAGLLKCVLMLRHGVTPPNVHFKSLNPHLDLTGYPVYLCDDMCEIGTNSGYAGVSSFGFGGTNARADIWAKAVHGPRKVQPVDFDKLQAVGVRCPTCLGWMDFRSGSMLPSELPEQSAQGRERARCIRDEFDSYNSCSLCYKGSYQFGKPPSEGPLPQARVCIKGTWDGFSNFEEMKFEAGAFHHHVRLGETRMERFYLALEENDELAVFPSHTSGGMDVRVLGPRQFEAGHHFVIDCRDDQIPEGTLIHITAWTESRHLDRKVAWKVEPEEGGSTELQAFQHSYQVIGSLTQARMIPMKPIRGVRNVFEYSTRIGLAGQETFQFARDHDWSQGIYPARDLALSGKVPVRGPDHLGAGNFFAVRGQQGERLALRLEVSDAHVTISASCHSSGTVTWHSIEGRRRRRLSVAGTWAEGYVMKQDGKNPDRYTAQVTVSPASCSEEFQILIDEDPKRAFYPEVSTFLSAGALVCGPDACGGLNRFVIEGSPGSIFEICLDLKSANKWETVTWHKVPTDSLQMPLALQTPALLPLDYAE